VEHKGAATNLDVVSQVILSQKGNPFCPIYEGDKDAVEGRLVKNEKLGKDFYACFAMAYTVHVHCVFIASKFPP
jgi:hypothetical protein